MDLKQREQTRGVIRPGDALWVEGPCSPSVGGTLVVHFAG